MFIKINDQIFSDKLCAAYIIKYKYWTRRNPHFFD